jgi:hypothetical protein
VCDLDDPQQVLKRRDQVGQVLGRSRDPIRPPAGLHRRKVLLAQLVVLPEVPPKVIPVAAAAQKVQVRLADGDVVPSGVAVQLLVPLRNELVLDSRPVPLLDAV